MIIFQHTTEQSRTYWLLVNLKTVNMNKLRVIKTKQNTETLKKASGTNKRDCCEIQNATQHRKSAKACVAERHGDEWSVQTAASQKHTSQFTDSTNRLTFSSHFKLFPEFRFSVVVKSPTPESSSSLMSTGSSRVTSELQLQLLESCKYLSTSGLKKWIFNDAFYVLLI